MPSVFVVDRTAFFGGEWPQGFTPMTPSSAVDFLQRARTVGRFVDRQEAERTPAWKQWIPYCAVRCFGGESTTVPTAVLVVQRTRGQSEARLHGARSIGLGGHIEPEDVGPEGGGPEGGGPGDGQPGDSGPGEHDPTAAGPAFFARSLLRELHEELDLRLPEVPSPRLLGMINDDSTEVGSVHAGLAYVLDLPLGPKAAANVVGIREISKMRGGFAHLVELQRLWQDASGFESWSQILIRAGIVGPMGAITAPATEN